MSKGRFRLLWIDAVGQDLRRGLKQDRAEHSKDFRSQNEPSRPDFFSHQNENRFPFERPVRYRTHLVVSQFKNPSCTRRKLDRGPERAQLLDPSNDDPTSPLL